MTANIEQIKSLVSSYMSKNRFEHTCRVMDTALRFAQLYNIDTYKVEYSCLIHDLAKEMTPDIDLDGLVFTDKEHLLFTEYPAVWHALVIPKVSNVILNTSDNDILMGAKWHTTGKSDMSTLDKIVYISDYLEPGRDIDNRLEIINIARDDLDLAVCIIAIRSMKYLINQNKRIHPFSLDCYNYYIFKLESLSEKNVFLING